MNFFDKFLGQWMTKKNIYILKYNFRYTYEEQVKVTKNEDENLLYDYELNHRDNKFYINYSNYFFERKKQSLTNIYNVKEINKNLLQISQKVNEKIFFIEYIYCINENFNTSIGFIKSNKKYLATIFTSYIKIYSK